MNDRTVMIIEKIFLAVMGCIFIFIGFVGVTFGLNVEPDEPIFPAVIFFMTPGVLVLMGLIFTVMAVVAHIVIVIVVVLIMFVTWGESGFSLMYISLPIAILLLVSTIRRSMRGQ